MFTSSTILSPPVAGYASSGSYAHTQAVIPSAVAIPASKSGTHLVRSNSETDARQLEKALKEQLQFGESENEDKKI